MEAKLAYYTRGQTMFVKYEGETPFGLKENFDKEGNYLV